MSVFRDFSLVKMGAPLDALTAHDVLTNPSIGLSGLHRMGSYGDQLSRIVGQQLSQRKINGIYGNGGISIVSERLYSVLQASESIELQLNSNVISVDLLEDGHLFVKFIDSGGVHIVISSQCICTVPYLCADKIFASLPLEIRDLLVSNGKVPNITAPVLIRSGLLLKDLGATSFYFPDQTLSEGFACDYDSPHKISAEPVLIGAIIGQGNSWSERYERGRDKIYRWTDEDLKVIVKSQLACLFRKQQFDPEGDILSVQINRWPYGFSSKIQSSRRKEVLRVWSYLFRRCG